MNRKSLALAVIAVALGLAPVAAHADLVLPRISPKASAMQQIGTTDLTVSYSRPGVKGRAIWGGLVPWGQPWRTGANEATTLTNTTEVKIGGQTLPAGTYTLITIPAEGEWTVIVSNQKGLWAQGPYDEKQDLFRFKAKPTASENVEWLQFTFEDVTANSTNLVMRWEKLALPIPVTVDVNGLTMAHARDEVAKAKADDWRTPYRAAQWTFDNNVSMDEGSKWLEQSIKIEPSYSNMNLKARWLAKNGDTKGAIASAEQAIAINKKAKTPADATQLETMLAEWTGKKK